MNEKILKANSRSNLESVKKHIMAQDKKNHQIGHTFAQFLKKLNLGHENAQQNIK